MDSLYELKDMLMDELEKCVEKGELSAGSLEIIDKLTHSVKSIDTIIAMEDAGYSNDDYSGNYSYARGRGRNARRDSRGRYSRDAYNRYSYRGYSRDNKELVEQLKDLEMNVTDENTKNMIRKFIMQAEEN